MDGMAAVGGSISGRWIWMRGLLEQVVRFGGVGVLNTIVGLAIIWLAMWVGMPPIASNAIGYAVGLTLSFWLNRSWTFEGGQQNNSSSGLRSEAQRFFIAFLTAWLLNVAVVWMGLHYTTSSPYLLQIAGMATYTLMFFVICRVWVFLK